MFPNLKHVKDCQLLPGVFEAGWFWMDLWQWSSKKRIGLCLPQIIIWWQLSWLSSSFSDSFELIFKSWATQPIQQSKLGSQRSVFLVSSPYFLWLAFSGQLQINVDIYNCEPLYTFDECYWIIYVAETSGLLPIVLSTFWSCAVPSPYQAPAKDKSNSQDFCAFMLLKVLTTQVLCMLQFKRV